MAKSNLLSNRVKVVSPKEVSVDRYQFLDLSQAEPNLGVPASGSISSGSLALVASDADGNRFFVTSINLNEFSGSFSGSFQGSGEQLRNVKILESGSASAQILSDQFIINVPTNISGNLSVEGNLYVTDAIYAEQIIVSYISSSIIYSSGSNIFGDNVEDKQEFTGSVEISGSITLSDGTFYSGSGQGLFDIPRSALAPDALTSPLIATGSLTASLDVENNIFIVKNLEGPIKTELSGSLGVSGSVFLNSG